MRESPSSCCKSGEADLGLDPGGSRVSQPNDLPFLLDEILNH